MRALTMLLSALLVACSAGELIRAAKNSGDNWGEYEADYGADLSDDDDDDEHLDEIAIAETEKQLAKVSLPDDVKILGDILRDASNESGNDDKLLAEIVLTGLEQSACEQFQVEVSFNPGKSCDSFVRMVEETLSSSSLGQSRAWRQWERYGGDAKFARQFAPKFSEYLALVKVCRIAHPDDGRDPCSPPKTETLAQESDTESDSDDEDSDDDDDDDSDSDDEGFDNPRHLSPEEVYVVRKLVKSLATVPVPDEVIALGKLLRKQFKGESLAKIFAKHPNDADFASFRKTALTTMFYVTDYCRRFVMNVENNASKCSTNHVWYRELWEENMEEMESYFSPRISKYLTLARACKLIA